MKRALALFASLVPTFAFALGNTGGVIINNLQIISDGSQRAFINGITVNNGGCSNSTPELLMDSSNPLAGAMYATLVSAAVAGQYVRIQTLGCSASGSPLVISVTLFN